MPWRSRSPLVLGLMAAMVALVAVTVVGLVTLWPSGEKLRAPEITGRLDTEQARVVSVGLAECPGAGDTSQRCRSAVVLLESGPEEGRSSTIDVAQWFDLDPGDTIRVARVEIRDPVTGPRIQYSFSDFERRGAMTWFAAAFVLLVLLTARWHGLRALVGLAGSLALVVWFIVPATLQGRSPLWVALIGAFAVMLLTVPLAHGLGTKTIAASLGTAVSLLLTLFLAEVAVGAANLTGFSSDEVTFLAALAPDLSIRGLLLAGMVIGALGVLDDLTVSQASTVVALRKADPRLGAMGLFRGALAVGRDHITATVNTLVLAYVGAALPTLLVFGLAETALGDAVNGEVVAVEVISMLVGSIGLVAAVPVTTGLAALLAVRLEPGALGDGGNHHHHHH